MKKLTVILTILIISLIVIYPFTIDVTDDINYTLKTNEDANLLLWTGHHDELVWKNDCWQAVEENMNSLERIIQSNKPEFQKAEAAYNRLKESMLYKLDSIEYSNLSLEDQIIYATNLSLEEKINLKAELKAQEMAFANYTVKVIVSLLFTLVALFIILSKRYDKETKKWAIGVLTLIAGVWIGTVT